MAGDFCSCSEPPSTQSGEVQERVRKGEPGHPSDKQGKRGLEEGEEQPVWGE